MIEENNVDKNNVEETAEFWKQKYDDLFLRLRLKERSMVLKDTFHEKFETFSEQVEKDQPVSWALHTILITLLKAEYDSYRMFIEAGLSDIAVAPSNEELVEQVENLETLDKLVIVIEDKKAEDSKE